MFVNSYLFFGGKAEEAIAFYEKAAGAHRGMVMKFRDSPDLSSVPPGMGEYVMHGEFRLGETMVFVSDGQSLMEKPKFDGFALTITTKTKEETESVYNGLLEGGEVMMPLSQTFFCPLFGMLTDRFGVHWMVMMESQGM